MPEISPVYWKCGPYQLSLERPLVMGIVNVTPDSFSDGGRWDSADAAVRHGEELISEGADILDVGGESTRPGSDPVPEEEELRRVIPVIEKLSKTGVPVSVDTNKPNVMRAALKAGAAIVNDVWGFRKPGAVEAVANCDCGLCVMHMQNDPKSMQIAPTYDAFLEEVKTFLKDRADVLEKAGVKLSRICLDPGFGFGKTDEQNFELIARVGDLAELGFPLLYGMSRKSSLGRLTGVEKASARVISSVTAHVLAAERGANILRVHDVRATVEGLKVLEAVTKIKDK